MPKSNKKYYKSKSKSKSKSKRFIRNVSRKRYYKKRYRTSKKFKGGAAAPSAAGPEAGPPSRLVGAYQLLGNLGKSARSYGSKITNIAGRLKGKLVANIPSNRAIMSEHSNFAGLKPYEGWYMEGRIHDHGLVYFPGSGRLAHGYVEWVPMTQERMLFDFVLKYLRGEEIPSLPETVQKLYSKKAITLKIDAIEKQSKIDHIEGGSSGPQGVASPPVWILSRLDKFTNVFELPTRFTNEKAFNRSALYRLRVREAKDERLVKFPGPGPILFNPSMTTGRPQDQIIPILDFSWGNKKWWMYHNIFWTIPGSDKLELIKHLLMDKESNNILKEIWYNFIINQPITFTFLNGNNYKLHELLSLKEVKDLFEVNFREGSFPYQIIIEKIKEKEKTTKNILLIPGETESLILVPETLYRSHFFKVENPEGDRMLLSRQKFIELVKLVPLPQLETLMAEIFTMRLGENNSTGKQKFIMKDWYDSVKKLAQIIAIAEETDKLLELQSIMFFESSAPEGGAAAPAPEGGAAAPSFNKAPFPRARGFVREKIPRLFGAAEPDWDSHNVPVRPWLERKNLYNLEKMLELTDSINMRPTALETATTDTERQILRNQRNMTSYRETQIIFANMIWEMTEENGNLFQESTSIPQRMYFNPYIKRYGVLYQ